MPCGRYRRDQFRSQSEYEAHREKMMKLILGDDWQDKPLDQLVTEHPELQRISLPDLLHRAHHLEQVQQERSAIPWKVEVIAVHPTKPDAQTDVVTEQPRPTKQPLAIEGGKPRQTAEDWLKQYLNPDAPDDAVLKSNKTKRRGSGQEDSPHQ